MDVTDTDSTQLKVNYLIIRLESVDCVPDYTVHYCSSSPSDPDISPFPSSISKQTTQNHRGLRQFHKISITSYTTEELLAQADHITQLQMDTKHKEEADQLNFFCGNPQTENTHGILHFYKKGSSANDEEKPRMLCMTAVPACLTLQDLTNFLSQYSKFILEVKIIRDITPNQYMVLLLFDKPSSAQDFYNSHNQSRYNLVEPHVCSMAYVSRVETVKSSLGACFPIRGAVELPVCPVCLDQLDEPLDGVLTILCNHSFHVKCLEKWENSSGTCPVCRFLQTPPATDGTSCTVCGDEEDLWICLLCGHVGCGRYAQGHARVHFEETSHTFALEVGQNGVWDYVADSFVHRLVQNKGDGKIVQVTGEYDNCDEKMDAVTMEFTYLLTSQLESQRLYYEEQLKKQERGFREALETNETIGEDKKQLLKQVQDLKNEKSNLEKKLQQVNIRLQKLQRDMDEERGFNSSLRTNQKEWQLKLDTLQAKYTSDLKKREADIVDLQEQLQDLLFHMDAKNKLSKEMTSEELEGSHILVGEATGGATSSDHKTKRKSNRRQ